MIVSEIYIFDGRCSLHKIKLTLLIPFKLDSVTNQTFSKNQDQKYKINRLRNNKLLLIVNYWCKLGSKFGQIFAVSILLIFN